MGFSCQGPGPPDRSSRVDLFRPSWSRTRTHSSTDVRRNPRGVVRTDEWFYGFVPKVAERMADEVVVARDPPKPVGAARTPHGVPHSPPRGGPLVPWDGRGTGPSGVTRAGTVVAPPAPRGTLVLRVTPMSDPGFQRRERGGGRPCLIRPATPLSVSRNYRRDNYPSIPTARRTVPAS